MVVALLGEVDGGHIVLISSRCSTRTTDTAPYHAFCFEGFHQLFFAVTVLLKADGLASTVVNIIIKETV